jgi:hypothetical protein
MPLPTSRVVRAVRTAEKEKKESRCSMINCSGRTREQLFQGMTMHVFLLGIDIRFYHCFVNKPTTMHGQRFCDEQSGNLVKLVHLI